MSFNNVSQVIVAGPAINNASRDQFNVTAEVVHIGSRADDDGEFKRVTTGDMYLLKEIYGEWWSGKTIYSVELPEQKMKCTAITYNGPGAQEDWEEDFRRFSHNRSPDAWQLYGLNRSNVPFLIFHDELVPLGHFYKNSFWGDFFVEWLRRKLGCRNESEIWLSTRGTLIKGPKGPTFVVGHTGTIHGIPIPSSAEMLKDDISFQFFQKFPSAMLDHYIVRCTEYHSIPLDHPKRFFRDAPLNILLENTPGILDGLHVDIVYSPSLGAVARWRDGWALWETDEWLQGLADKTVMDDGLIRFKLQGPEVYARFYMKRLKFEESWLSQSSRIIDACRMSGTEEQCFIATPPAYLILKSIPRRYLNQQRILPFENPLSIYLFIYPLPMTVSEIESWGKNRTHFWSCDENGRSEMTEEECCRWRVLELNTHVKWHGQYVYRWPSHVYTAIRNWQVARGFDPTTADFARSLGYPELDILIDNEPAGSCFEEVHENSATPDKQNHQNVPEELDTPLPVEVAITQPPLTTSTPKPSRIPVPIPHSKVEARPKADTSLRGRLSAPQPKHSYPTGDVRHSRIPIPTWRAQGKSWRSVLEGGTVDGSDDLEILRRYRS